MDKRRGNFEPTYKKCTECGSNVRQFKNNKRSDDDKCSKCRWTINRKAYIKKIFIHRQLQGEGAQVL